MRTGVDAIHPDERGSRLSRRGRPTAARSIATTGGTAVGGVAWSHVPVDVRTLHVVDGPVAVTGVSAAVGAVVLVGLVALAVYLFLEAFQRPSVPVIRDEPASVLSDRDRILLLIERHDGRMRQQEIVAQVEWSKAKVSRLLSELEEEGTLRKLRLGRENLICLESHDPFDRG